MHIERCLFWKGEVQRADLVDTFEVTAVQAANDFRLYMEIFPGNMAYDRSLRRYVPQTVFSPALIRPETLDEFALMPSARVPVAHWPLPVRRATPEVLLAIVAAVRERRKIEVQYQSMSGQVPEWRWLSPHAFASDAERWHVRAFCHTRQQFRDFVLGRILATRAVDGSDIDPMADTIWHSYADVLVTPNPRLEAEQRQAIGAEYQLPPDLELVLKLRESMLFYVKAKFDPNGTEHPAAHQLFVAALKTSR
ncbi:WYL domain-containing protein [Duganella caerulea]|uniref:helix-turn-helix transcriptional regulator n=1 Tax=Duganella caerulea TaxID=2885762 RepID=UPI0030E7AECA